LSDVIVFAWFWIVE